MFAFNDESNVGDKRSASSALLLQEDEEDEDEDEEIVPEIYQQLVNKKENVEKIPEQSDAYVESRQAIEMDAWDANAWFKMLDEVKSNRSGSFTVLEACEMFLKQYPRSSSVWMLYCDTLISLKKDQAAIEEAFKKCLKQCRNVALWKSYLQYMKTVTVDAAPRENYQLERKNLEHLYDICLESVGLVIDSDGIYQSYIAFIKSWPELSAQDPGRKLAALRKVYQRCISIPINNLDGFYREYVTLEKAISEHLAEQLLPELTEKYTEAKLVYKERKRLYSCINIDFLARNRDVCTNTNIYELEQLGAWTKYIRYEMSMKESMEESQHKSLMCLVFEQCLCCFRYYPEIWMSYCNYIKSTNITSSVLPIRALFREAISIIPSCAVLRIAWAEVEEEFGNVEISRDILKQGYEATLTPIAFGALQRFIYKKDGKTAARKCFSETYPLRMEALSQSKSESRSKLGLEVYLMHAELELNLNCDPTTALSILRYAQKHCQGDDAPISSDADVSFQHSHVDFNIYYVRLMTRVLLQLGKIDEVRCVFHIAFDSLLTICGLGSGSKTVGSASGHDAEATGSHATSAAPAVDAGLTVLSTSPLPMVLTSDSIAAASTTNTSIISSAINKEVFMKTQWLLWEEFLVIENT